MINTNYLQYLECKKENTCLIWFGVKEKHLGFKAFHELTPEEFYSQRKRGRNYANAI